MKAKLHRYLWVALLAAVASRAYAIDGKAVLEGEHGPRVRAAPPRPAPALVAAAGDFSGAQRAAAVMGPPRCDCKCNNDDQARNTTQSDLAADAFLRQIWTAP